MGAKQPTALVPQSAADVALGVAPAKGAKKRKAAQAAGKDEESVEEIEDADEVKQPVPAAATAAAFKEQALVLLAAADGAKGAVTDDEAREKKKLAQLIELWFIFKSDEPVSTWMLKALKALSNSLYTMEQLPLFVAQLAKQDGVSLPAPVAGMASPTGASRGSTPSASPSVTSKTQQVYLMAKQALMSSSPVDLSLFLHGEGEIALTVEELKSLGKNKPLTMLLNIYTWNPERSEVEPLLAALQAGVTVRKTGDSDRVSAVHEAVSELIKKTLTPTKAADIQNCMCRMGAFANEHDLPKLGLLGHQVAELFHLAHQETSMSVATQLLWAEGQITAQLTLDPKDVDFSLKTPRMQREWKTMADKDEKNTRELAAVRARAAQEQRDVQARQREKSERERAVGREYRANEIKGFKKDPAYIAVPPDTDASNPLGQKRRLELWVDSKCPTNWICRKFNDAGGCKFEVCTYLHICSRANGACYLANKSSAPHPITTCSKK